MNNSVAHLVAWDWEGAWVWAAGRGAVTAEAKAATVEKEAGVRDAEAGEEQAGAGQTREARVQQAGAGR